WARIVFGGGWTTSVTLSTWYFPFLLLHSLLLLTCVKVVTRTVLHINYTDQLLENVAMRFAKLVDATGGVAEAKYDFEQKYASAVRKAENSVDAATKMRSFVQVPSKKKVEQLPEKRAATSLSTTASVAAVPEEAPSDEGGDKGPLTAEEI